jgi:hypothetical protein
MNDRIHGGHRGGQILRKPLLELETLGSDIMSSFMHKSTQPEVRWKEIDNPLIHVNINTNINITTAGATVVSRKWKYLSSDSISDKLQLQSNHICQKKQIH